MKAGLLSLGSRAVHCCRGMRRHSWHAQTSARAATLAALCGLAAAQNLPPLPAPAPPGMCKDTLDKFRDPNYNVVTKCCVDGARDKTMVW